MSLLDGETDASHDIRRLQDNPYEHCRNSDNGAVDADGNGCSYFDVDPSRCPAPETIQIGDFVQNCCACGRGESGTCTDQDNGELDANGLGCSYYTSNSTECSSGDQTFVQKGYCCACNGGSYQWDSETEDASNTDNNSVNTDQWYQLCRSTDNNGETDSQGQNCDFYNNDPLACLVPETLSEGDFRYYCCACGGGESGTCTDKDDGIVDNQNRGCDYYALNSFECQSGDPQFLQQNLCCACGGGETAWDSETGDASNTDNSSADTDQWYNPCRSTDNNGETDYQGNTCDDYKNDPLACLVPETLSEGDFRYYCCACGGGESGTCTDKDDGIVDNQNRGCDYYALNSFECQSGDPQFLQQNLCCACGGGETGWPSESGGQSGNDSGQNSNDPYSQCQDGNENPSIPTTDPEGNDCSYYNEDGSRCPAIESIQIDDFIQRCCQCGGGIRSSCTDANYVFDSQGQPISIGQGDWVDSQNRGCSFYNENPHECSVQDHPEHLNCCVCGGGQVDSNDDNSQNNDDSGNNNSDSNNSYDNSISSEPLPSDGVQCQDLWTPKTFYTITGDTGDTYSCSQAYCDRDAHFFDHITNEALFFIPKVKCCVCGGGLRQDSKYTPTTSDCKDTDTPVRQYDVWSVSPEGSEIPQYCSFYTDHPQMCMRGSQVDYQLKPQENCCACGGGVPREPQADDVTFETGLLCRDSDFRTVAGDPYYEVIQVHADVQESGYIMLNMLKVVPRDSPNESPLTYIYVFDGWRCKVELEVEILSQVITATITARTVTDQQSSRGMLRNGFEVYITDQNEETRYSSIVYVLTRESDSFKLLTYTGKTYTGYSIIRDDLETLPIGLKVENSFAHVVFPDFIYTLDHSQSSPKFTTIQMDQLIQVATSEQSTLLIHVQNGRLAATMISGESTISLAIDRDYAGLPVVQAGLSQSTSAVAICSYIPEASDHVLLDQFTIDLAQPAVVKSQQAPTNSECLAAIAPTESSPYSSYMLLLSDRKLLTVRVNQRNDQVTSKKSINAATLPSFIDSGTFGVALFHSEQFVYGMKDSINDYQLSTIGYSLESLNNFRNSDFYRSDFGNDNSITDNSFDQTSTFVTDVALQTSEMPINVESIGIGITSTFSPATYIFNRHGYIDEICRESHSPIVSDMTRIQGYRWSELKESAMQDDYAQQSWFNRLDNQEKDLLESLRAAQTQSDAANQVSASEHSTLFASSEYSTKDKLVCRYFLDTDTQTCTWTPISISSFSGNNHDVCYPLSVQDMFDDKLTDHSNYRVATGFRIEDNWIKPFDLADKNSDLGDADWFFSEMNDRQDYSRITFIQSQNAFVGRNTIETGESRTFDLLPSEYYPREASQFACDDLFALGFTNSDQCSGENLLYLNDDTIVSGKSWKQWKESPTFNDYLGFSDFPQILASLQGEDLNLILALNNAQKAQLFGGPLKNVPFNTNTYDAIKLKGNTVIIDGEETKSWSCFSTFLFNCDIKTAQPERTLMSIWQFIYFSAGRNDGPAASTSIKVEGDVDANTVLKELKDSSLDKYLGDIPSLDWVDYKKALQLSVNHHQSSTKQKSSQRNKQVTQEEVSELHSILDQKQIDKAIEEAKQRESTQEELSQKPVSVTVDILEEGVVALSFDREVAWPSYMLYLLEQGVSGEQQKDTNQGLRQLSASSTRQPVSLSQVPGSATLTGSLSQQWLTWSEDVPPDATGGAFNTIIQEEQAIAKQEKAKTCKEDEYLDTSENCVKLVEDREEEKPIIEEEEVEWNVGKLSDYVKLKVIKQSGEIIELDWYLVEHSSNGLQISMTDEQRSKLVKTDKLIVDLPGIKTLDRGMPDQNFNVDLSRFFEEEEVQVSKVQEAKTAAKSALLLSTIVRVVTKGSLAELWGAINGMQLAANQPIINIEIPDLAASFSSAIAEVVTFDFDHTNYDEAFGWLSFFELPEDDPIMTDLRLDDATMINGKLWKQWKEESTDPDYFLSDEFNADLTASEREKVKILVAAQEEIGWKYTEIDGEGSQERIHKLEDEDAKSEAAYFIQGLELLGFENAYISRCLGTAFLWILLTSIGLILILVLSPLKRFKSIEKIVNKLKEKLLWNTVLRTVMQTSLEFGFCIVFTLQYGTFEWSFGPLMNYSFAVVFAILLCTIPIFFIVFYKSHFEQMHVKQQVNHDDDELLRKSGDVREVLKDLGSKLDQLENLEELCTEFYMTGDADEVEEMILEYANNGQPFAVIHEVTERQVEFLSLLDDLNYIENLDVVDVGKGASKRAVIQLNGNFRRNYKNDMKSTEARLDFMSKFGDPLDGLDLTKDIVIWYPTYFMLVRIVFVISTLLLWDRPLTVICIRIATSLFGFCAVSVIRPYDDSLAVRLELMNEATIILLCDLIILFTSLLNAGSAVDLSSSSFAANTIRLDDQRWYTSALYVGLFSGNISIHLLLLLLGQLRTLKAYLKRQRLYLARRVSREKAYQKKLIQLKDLDEMNELTIIGGKAWRDIRKKAVKKNYAKKSWFQDLTSEEQQKVEALREVYKPFKKIKKRSFAMGLCKRLRFWYCSCFGFGFKDKNFKRDVQLGIIQDEIESKKEVKNKELHDILQNADRFGNILKRKKTAQRLRDQKAKQPHARPSQTDTNMLRLPGKARQHHHHDESESESAFGHQDSSQSIIESSISGSIAGSHHHSQRSHRRYLNQEQSQRSVLIEDESDDSFKKDCESSEVDARLNEISEYEDIRVPKIASRESSNEGSRLDNFKHPDVEQGLLQSDPSPEHIVNSMRQFGATEFSFQVNQLEEVSDHAPPKKTPLSAFTVDSAEAARIREDSIPTSRWREFPTPGQPTNVNAQSASSHADQPNSQEADENQDQPNVLGLLAQVQILGKNQDKV